MRGLTRALRALAAAAGLFVLLIGPPWFLIAFIGNPWPDEGVSLTAPLTDNAFVGLVAAIAWLAWAQLVVVTVVEAAWAVRGIRGVSLPERSGVLGSQQRLVRSLIATITAAIVVSGTASAQAVNQPQTSSPPAAAAQPTASEQDTNTGQTTITVGRGDSLWGLAIAHLGDGQRWHEIANLNQGRIMGDGQRFDPDRIKPGWMIRIPARSAVYQASNQARTAGTHVRVRRGDTLSSLAQRHLGDAGRWPELMRLNRGQEQAVGGRLADPDQLKPGWILTLPQHHPSRDAAPPARNDDGRQEHIQRIQPLTMQDHSQVQVEPAGQGADTTTPPRAEQTQDSDRPHVGPDEIDVDTTTVPEADDTVFDAPWIVAGLIGAGVLLAGSLFLGLRQRRRTQLRHRKPGRGIAQPDAELAPIEMTIRAAGTPSAVLVEHLEAVLRRLAAATRCASTPMPALAAVEMTAQRVTLHLSEPTDVPAPWQGTPDRAHWHVDIDTDLDEIGPIPDHSEPPYPQLVTVGEGDDGSLWLLNCEELGTVALTGDVDRGRDFARHITTQLAVNPWSASVQIDCVGLVAEADGLNERLTHHDPDQSAAATTEILAEAVSTADRATEHDTDVSTGRAGGVDDDAWPSRLLLWDGAHPHTDDLQSLLHTVQTQRGRTATTVLLTGPDCENVDGFEIRLTSHGRVVLDHAGLDLAAVGLSADETRGCALLYAQSETIDDVAVPVPEAATTGWEAYADLAGALRVEHTVLRHEPTHTGETSPASLLDGDDDDYLEASAIVPEDLQALAPAVPTEIRNQVESQDPYLDDDVADWFATDCDRPRLSLLGPVEAHTHGKALAKRKPYFTELLAFLALHRRNGATSDELCEAFGITPQTAHNYIKTTRSWLGTNPTTGQWHLPHADKSPAAQTRGVNVYQVDDGLLVDADLFKRLRIRGQARGGDAGLRDLAQALDLVNGRPFDQLREAGWAWLINGERHDEYLTVAVADVALTVATDYLERGDVLRARTAAELAVLAAPDEEHTRLCLARVNEADGNPDEATRIIRDDVCNRTDDGGAPTELNERTKAIIRDRQWLAS